MSPNAITARIVPPLVLPGVQIGSPAYERISPRHPGLWRRLFAWAKELLLLMGAVYAFPIAILVIGIPLALAINGLLIAAGWAWNAFW